jgi:CRISPR-associated protein Cmr2
MTRYTAVTFAPVQGFIEKSRKLRDLYGSSFILSFLAKTVCNYAVKKGAKVIVPALISVTRGVPNNIYLDGTIDAADLRVAFDRAWKALVDTCRQYIERQYQANTNNRSLTWKREWDAWANHAWELFVISGDENESLDDVRARMSDRKQARDWVGINWRGESSTLAGADAIAYPNMAEYHPKNSPNADAEIREFYTFLSQHLPESAVEPRERLSIPELVKRLITYAPVRKQFVDNFQGLPKIESLDTFKEIDRSESGRWTGWFQGDGDRLGEYISSLGSDTITNKDTALNEFSDAMIRWGEGLQQRTQEILTDRIDGRIVYAGGDDFFGVLYRNSQDGDPLTPQACLEKWWYKFNDLWNECDRPITVSTGFVWAAPNVPQRDLLQHLRTTEKLAKTQGRDRLAIRVLFNSGNYLDWSCPWNLLEELLTSYEDRSGGNNWGHFYTDIATLESRHAFAGNNSSVAQGIFDLYFPTFAIDPAQWWNQLVSETATYQRLQGGLLGTRPDREIEQHQHRTRWIIDLAKVGFHLFR